MTKMDYLVFRNLLLEFFSKADFLLQKYPRDSGNELKIKERPKKEMLYSNQLLVFFILNILPHKLILQKETEKKY